MRKSIILLLLIAAVPVYGRQINADTFIAGGASYHYNSSLSTATADAFNVGEGYALLTVNGNLVSYDYYVNGVYILTGQGVLVTSADVVFTDSWGHTDTWSFQLNGVGGDPTSSTAGTVDLAPILSAMAVQQISLDRIAAPTDDLHFFWLGMKLFVPALGVWIVCHFANRASESSGL